MRIRWLVFSVVAGAFVALAVACGGGDGDGGDRNYPDQVRNNYMTSCTRSGGTQEQCRCTLEAVEAKYNLDEFTQLEQDIAKGQRFEELTSIVTGCATTQ